MKMDDGVILVRMRFVRLIILTSRVSNRDDISSSFYFST